MTRAICYNELQPMPRIAQTDSEIDSRNNATGTGR